MKKKILILSMSCNKHFFKNQETFMKMTWASDVIEGRYPNIDFYIYTSTSQEKPYIDHDSHKIYVPSQDTLLGTWQKTLKAFKVIQQKDFPFNDYDYILRTNTSTFINVGLLDQFVQKIEDEDIFYSGTLLCPQHTTGPYEWCIYPQGNSMLFHKKYLDILTDNENIQKALKIDMSNFQLKIKKGNLEDRLHVISWFIDDTMIGIILNTYFFNQQKNHMLFYKSFGCAILSETPKEDLEKYISIIVKDSQDEKAREKENKLLIDLYYLMKDKNFQTDFVEQLCQENIVTFIPDQIKGTKKFFSSKDIKDYLQNISEIPYLDQVLKI